MKQAFAILAAIFLGHFALIGGQSPSLDALFARTVVITMESGRQLFRGTGFLLEPDVVVTNYHVVGGSDKDQRSLKVVLGGVSSSVTKVLGIDEQNDLVLLRTAKAFPDLPVISASTNPILEGGRIYGMGFSLDTLYPVKVQARFRKATFFAAQQLYIIEGITGQGQSGSAVVDDYGRLVGVIMGAMREQTVNGLVIPWAKIEQLRLQGDSNLGLDSLRSPKLVPNEHPKLQELVQALAEHDFESLVVTGQALLSEFPQSPELHYYVGQGWYGKKEFRRAEEAFKQAVALVPGETYPDALGGLGLVALNKGDEALALSFFQRALALNASQMDALYQLARLSVNKRQYVEASKLLERYIALAPKDKDAWELLARAKAKLGDAEGAKEAFRVSGWLVRVGSERVAKTPTWQRLRLWLEVQWSSLFG